MGHALHEAGDHEAAISAFEVGLDELHVPKARTMILWENANSKTLLEAVRKSGLSEPERKARICLKLAISSARSCDKRPVEFAGQPVLEDKRDGCAELAVEAYACACQLQLPSANDRVRQPRRRTTRHEPRSSAWARACSSN